MTEQTPPPVPETVAQHTAEPGGATSAKARSVTAGNGITWIADAFDLFKENAGIWILMVVTLLVLFLVLGLLGPLSIAGDILVPMVIGGLMLGCSDQARGQELKFQHLFAGFQQHTGALATVGALYLLGGIAVFLVALFAALLSGASSSLLAMIGGHPDIAALAGIGIGLLIALLIAMAASIPLIMAVWFAPALVVFEDMAAIDAMKLSFIACLHNVLPFFLWGLVMLVLYIIGVVTLGLGFLVIVPVQIISIYTAYRDIFVTA